MRLLRPFPSLLTLVVEGDGLTSAVWTSAGACFFAFDGILELLTGRNYLRRGRGVMQGSIRMELCRGRRVVTTAMIGTHGSVKGRQFRSASEDHKALESSV